MKMSSFLATSTLSIIAIANQATATATGGVCYDPDHVDSVTEATISADFQTIKEKGFDLVRTYVTTYGYADMATLAIAQGLNVSLGVPFDNDNPSATADYVTAAISAGALSNGSASVIQIFVGNENLASVDAVPSEMLTYISQLQEALPNVAVGTVQRNTEMLDSSRYSAISGLADLFTACDVVGVNIQPVFTADTAVADAITLVSDEWTELQGSDTESRFPGLADKLAITETGWPSAGSADGNTGSVAGAQQFYSDYMMWAAANLDASRSHYFRMFDLPSRTDTVFEAHFGICDEDGNSKFTL
ncbi:putative beta-glucosidase btgE [Phytophthora citrophthora]|uniref:glucan endo-1,3-beta-D-glucosidase n=1 Tax=Phytophthora citrophthora TaxID=4793 RepID=A0AAD9LBA4_9STRA|nr:putative beta-glucosidase btgE [Phytophthora citrophthora]